MAIPKIMGSETEYGIIVPGSPESSPVLTSSLLVDAFAGSNRRVLWDYAGESPLRDARGFDMPGREGYLDEEMRPADVVLSNGGRFYVDHAHPEYSTPECADALELVRFDKAGERTLAMAADRAFELTGTRVVVYKNNTDGKGSSYGTHENYLVSRATPFERITRDFMSFLVSRQIICGAGLLGRGSDGSRPDFRLSQRADFFEQQVGLETTANRPIINTRDEPHADPEKYRRLHVIAGDANMCEVASFLKFGTAALTLGMIEDDAVGEGLALRSPVAALHAISRDPFLKERFALADGREVRAIDLQWAYFERAKSYLQRREVDPVTAEVVSRWEGVLTRLGQDPSCLMRELDWVAKLSLLTAMRERDGLNWNHPKLHMADLQYHDVRRDRGLYYRLEAAGRIERMVGESEIARAVEDPPLTTRAYFRGRCVAKYPKAVAAVGWDAIVFDTGETALKRVPMAEPGRGGRSQVGDLLDACEEAGDLVDALSRLD